VNRGRGKPVLRHPLPVGGYDMSPSQQGEAEYHLPLPQTANAKLPGNLEKPGILERECAILERK